MSERAEMVRLRGVDKGYGQGASRVEVLRSLDLEVRTRRDGGGGRSLGGGQEHPAAPARAARPARAAEPSSWSGRTPGGPPSASRAALRNRSHRVRVPAPSPARRADARSTTSRCRLRIAGAPGAPGTGPRGASCSRRWGSPSGLATFRTSSRAASSSESRWPGRSRQARSCCWPTSRPETSTRATPRSLFELVRELHLTGGADVDYSDPQRGDGPPVRPSRPARARRRPIPIMFENFNEHARRSLFFARYEASRSRCRAIASEHLLLGMLREADEASSTCSSSSRSTSSRCAPSWPATWSPSTRRAPRRICRSPRTPRKRSRSRSTRPRVAGSHPDVGTEHLLLGMLRIEGSRRRPVPRRPRPRPLPAARGGRPPRRERERARPRRGRRPTSPSTPAT